MGELLEGFKIRNRLDEKHGGRARGIVFA